MHSEQSKWFHHHKITILKTRTRTSSMTSRQSDHWRRVFHPSQPLNKKETTIGYQLEVNKAFDIFYLKGIQTYQNGVLPEHQYIRKPSVYANREADDHHPAIRRYDQLQGESFLRMWPPRRRKLKNWHLRKREKIISNKKKIQQARTQTINKLVQKIRKLKELKEKNPNNVKITDNLEKTPKIMGFVKKIKTIDIIRRILTLSKKPLAVLTNGRSQPDEIAVALLANNKILAGITNTLRTLLHLDDKNPNWKNEILEVSKRKKKLLENGKRKKSIKDGKTTKPNAFRKNPWKEENVHNDDVEKSVKNIDIPPSSEWKVEDIEKEMCRTKPKNVIGLVTSVKSVKQIKDTKSVDENKSTSEEPLVARLFQKPIKTVDSFFFTEAGDNYLSTVVIDRVQPEAPDDGLIRRERRGKDMRPSNRHNNINSNRRQSVLNGRVDKKHNFIAATRVEPKQTDEKLHPSWAAKQKQKPIIAQFKGQKVRFDDDGNDSLNKFSENTSNKFSSKPSKLLDVKCEDNLHPSWAAKQKLKPTITEFQGKKITFDD